MMKRAAVLGLLLAAATAALAAPVTITGTIRRPDGVLATGLATIELSTPCLNGAGNLILDRQLTVRFDNGAFSTQLEPTSVCPVTTYYRVRYRVDRVWISDYEYWLVPASPSTTTIAAVRLQPAAPPLFARATTKGDLAVFDGVNWARLAAATDGLCLKTNAATATGAEWGTCGGGGGGSGEANTASNLAGGVGVWASKVGVDLRFKSLLAGSNKISIAANGSGNTVDIDLVPANVTITTLGGWPAGVDTTELGYLDGLTSAIQTQIAGKAATSHTHAAADVTSGLLAAARIATGTPTGSKFLRDDQVWATPGGGGNVSGPGSSTDNYVVVWDGVSGTAIKMSGCKIVSSKLTCGDGTAPSLIELPELAANGSNFQAIYGAQSQSGDGCVIWPVGNPTTSQVLKDSGASATYESRTCRILGWAADDNSGGGSTSPGIWTGAPSWSAIPDFACGQAGSTITATGLAAGTILTVQPPAGLSTGVVARAVATTDTITLHACNISGAPVTPSGTFTILAVRGYQAAAATLDFGSICDGCVAGLTTTITGATTTMGSALAVPAALTGVQPFNRVTASDTVTVSLINLSGAPVDPASGSFSSAVFQ